MPSARRRIAIIITTLILAALPAMVPALILFADRDQAAGASAGIVAILSWVLVEALALLLITPIFTDMRLRITRALRISAVGIGAGVLISAPLAWMSLLSVGAALGLVAGIWVAQRELGRALGAVPESLRDDLQGIGAGARHLPGALRRLIGMLSGRHPIQLRPPETPPEAPLRPAELPVTSLRHRDAPAPRAPQAAPEMDAAPQASMPPPPDSPDIPPPALPALDDAPGRRRGDGL